MACEHKHLRCTDGDFFCLDCGAKVEPPAVKTETAEPPKRRAKKGETKK